MWIGHILQVIRIIPSFQCPTAGVRYNKELKTFEMIYSPLFLEKLTDKNVYAVLKHEVAHITEKHVYMYQTNKEVDKNRLNQAMDLVINQKIQDLPEGCLFVENFTDKNGQPFPKNLSVEQYYELLDGAKNSGASDKFDEHEWSEADKKELAEAMQELFKRAQNSYEKTTGQKSSEIADFLEINLKMLKGINFKDILKNALKSQIPNTDTKDSWARPSRRFGKIAAGQLPKPSVEIDIFGDTSGSMTYSELNDIIQMCYTFIKTGAKKINLSLFHSNVYLTKNLKKGFKFTANEFQSGGTDLNECFEMIGKSKPELAVFITDGYYDMPALPKNMKTKLFFIIKEGGNVDHPLKTYGKTVVYQS